MVTPWWVVLMVSSFVGLSFSFWGWLAVKVIGQGAKIAEIESRISSRETECRSRMDWLQRMDEKLNGVREDVAKIRGALETAGVERRHG